MSRLIGKVPDAREDWGQEEKEVTEDEMVGWHHRLNGHEFEQTPGDTEGQGSPEYILDREALTTWGGKELDMTKWLNNNSNLVYYFILQNFFYVFFLSFSFQNLTFS